MQNSHALDGVRQSVPADFTVVAPGRVNLLGEHTDYNALPVLPMAIEQHIRIRGWARGDRDVRAWCEGAEDESVSYELTTPIPQHPRGHWANYVKAGMQGILEDQTPGASQELHGCDIEISGNIPQGVGLSSSSALVVASALSLLAANRRSYDRAALAERMAEAEYYVGTRGGGMDQAASLCGESGKVLKIDFFPLRVRTLSLPDEATVVVCDSGVRAKKSEGALRAYNHRAAECRFGALLLRRFLVGQGRPAHFQRLGDLLGPPWCYSHGDLLALLDEALEEAYEHGALARALGDEDEMSAVLRDYSFTDESAHPTMVFSCGKRFRHIVSDAMRVERCLELLEKGDDAGFGSLMNKGHVSAQRDFEISCPELDDLVAAARDAGALGARLTGAGFGGCTVNLVRHKAADAFIRRMQGVAPIVRSEAPEDQPAVFASRPADGARIVLPTDASLQRD